MQGKKWLAKKRKGSEMLNIPFTLQLFLLAPSSCSSGKAMSPNEKENLPRKLLQVLIGGERNVAAYVDVKMENDFFSFDLSQTTEKKLNMGMI